MAEVPFVQVFLMIYLPWILTFLFGVGWVIWFVTAPKEVWTAWRIRNLPGLVGFTLFDDAGQGVLRAMNNVADKGIFTTKKDEYQIVATSPSIEDVVPQYQYRVDPEWDDDQVSEHKRLVDMANLKLREEAQAKRYMSETIKKRHTLYGKPHYIGLLSTCMSAAPATLGVMQESVDNTDTEESKQVNLVSVDVLKQVLTKAYPPARIESIGKRHENRVRKQGGFQIPGFLLVVILAGAVIILLGATGIVDFEAIGKSLLGGVQM